uniref:Uncharacterized protein n=1 Tax=Kalanchoe fedtschenkoi TaxID=63787 RepID=A0A7N1A605_KALFE
MKKLTKGIEESRKELEKITEDQKKFLNVFKKFEQKASKVQESYKMYIQHKIVVDKAKPDSEKMKKTVDELRASEVDSDYKLQELKKKFSELEMKGKGSKKKKD